MGLMSWTELGQLGADSYSWCLGSEGMDNCFDEEDESYGLSAGPEYHGWGGSFLRRVGVTVTALPLGSQKGIVYRFCSKQDTDHLLQPYNEVRY